MKWNFTVFSPSRITRNTVEELTARLAKITNQAFMLDSNMAGRVALYTAQKQKNHLGNYHDLMDRKLSEYMTVREMYFYLSGLINMALEETGQ